MHKRASSRNISVAQAMKLMLKKMLATNILVFGFAVPVTAGSLEDGRAAYEHRDFAIAERLFRPLAEHGRACRRVTLMRYFGIATRLGRETHPPNLVSGSCATTARAPYKAILKH